MICPYCSVDMEPIELNGKTFCSNCGLTIKSAPTVSQPTPVISTIPSGADSVVEEPKVDVPTTPNAEIAQPEPNLDNVTINEPPKAIIEEKEVQEEVANELKDKTEPISEPVLDPTTEIEKVPESENFEEILETPPASSSLAANQGITNVPSEVDPLIQKENKKEVEQESSEPIIGTLDKIEPPLANPDVSMAEAVKNIDTLGASGILLDILSNENVKKEDSKDQNALAAAEELIDKVKISDTPPKTKKQVEDVITNEKPRVQAVNLKDSVKVKINVLENSPANPLTHLEVEPKPEELEIEAPEAEQNHELGIKNQAAEENLVNIPDFSTQDDQKSSPELNFEPEVTSEDLIPQTEVEKIDNEVKDIFPASNAVTDTNIFTDLPSLKGRKKKTPEIIKKAEEELEKETKEDKPFVPTEIIEENKNNQKSLPLKDYFNQIAKSEKDKKKKHLTLKAKKERRKKIIITTFLSILSLATIIGVGTYIYFGYIKPANNTLPIAQSTPIEQDDKLPKDVVVGYVLSGKAVQDDENKTYTATYAFSGDSNRTITFTSQKTEKASDLLSEAVNNEKSDYQTFTVGQTEYFQLDDGSVLWTKSGYFYKLMVKGDTYKELVYKMAQSVE